MSRGTKQASVADRYALYQRAVQAPDHEVKFFDRVYRAEYGRPARVLREDFCAAGALCCEWVRGGEQRRAYGVDLDPEPVAWGQAHNLADLDELARARVELALHDARDHRGPRADVVAALNFSFFIFHTREALRGYFSAARRNLAPRGVLVLDMMGGWETMQEGKRDTRRIRAAGTQPGFTYIWEQERFDPITHAIRCHIHFRFGDGSELSRAFTYDWRLWSVPEVCELIREAGFRRADVYWEGVKRATGKGDGVWRRRAHAASDPAWIACVVGVK